MFIVRGILALFKTLTGSGLVGALERAHERKLTAQNDEDKLAAELDIKRIDTALEMARVRAGDRWGASSIGAFLIVIPFGLWISAIFAVSIINPNFGTNLVVHDVPPRIWDFMTVAFTALVVGDASKSFTRNRR